MFIWMVSFCFGVIILYCTGVLLPWAAYILAILFIFLFSRAKIAIPFCLFILGYAYADLEAEDHLASALPLAYENKMLKVEAYLCSLVKVRVRYSSAEFCISSIRDAHPKNANSVEGENDTIISKTPVRLLLRWTEVLDLDLSQTVHLLEVQLRRPHGVVNPVGQSYEQMLFQKRILATGKIISVLSGTGQAQESPVLSWPQKAHQSFISYRMSIVGYIESLVLDFDHGGILKALLSGDRSAISVSDNHVLSMTGTQHLMAISGLHVGVILFGLYRVLPKKKRFLMLIGLAGFVYIALVGFSASAQRAWVMCLFALLYVSGYFGSSKRMPFLLALCVVLIIDPLATLSMGFWFSFSCVALLLFLTGVVRSSHSIWQGFLWVQVVLFMGLLPINSHLGLPHSLSASLANLVAIPWVSLVVLPFSLVSLLVSFFDFETSRVLYLALSEILHVLMTFLESLEAVYRQVSIGQNLLVAFLLLFCLITCLLFLRFKLFAVSLGVAILVCVVFPSRIQKVQNSLLVFDSGQGLAIAMQWADQLWLYDTGPEFERSSIKDRVVLPYLRANQLLSSVTGVIISHGDLDHAGGAEQLIENIIPDHAWSGEVDRFSNSVSLLSCVEGMNWSKENGEIEVLYPFLNMDGMENLSSNNHSCVVRFSLNGKIFLLMGDLEGAAELELVKRYRHKLKADVLIAGHHGSKNGTSYALLKHVLPSIVVFSAGHFNRFGHPHTEVTGRATRVGAETYSTAEKGALQFDVSLLEPIGISVSNYRSINTSFW